MSFRSNELLLVMIITFIVGLLMGMAFSESSVPALERIEEQTYATCLMVASALEQEPSSCTTPPHISN